VQAASATEPNPAASANARPRRASVLSGILAAAVLFVVLFALLLYRALTVHPPQAALLVQADPHWDGAVLIVEGDHQPHPLSGDLNRANKYLVTFFLQPGDYRLHVRKGDREYVVVPVHLETEAKDRSNIGIDLRISRVPPPYPTTQP
jgi:hypothetical protein